MGIEQNRLKQYRKEIGLTQKEMANKLGITQQRYQQWESAKEDMRTSTLTKICQTFKISADYMLGLTDNMVPLCANCHNQLHEGETSVTITTEAISHEIAHYVGKSQKEDARGHYEVEQGSKP